MAFLWCLNRELEKPIMLVYYYYNLQVRAGRPRLDVAYGVSSGVSWGKAGPCKDSQVRGGAGRNVQALKP